MASVNERLVGADMSSWFCEVNEQFPGTAHCLRVDRVLHSAKSEYQDVMVFKSTNFGNCLVLDGCIQYTERDEAGAREFDESAANFSSSFFTLSLSLSPLSLSFFISVSLLFVVHLASHLTPIFLLYSMCTSQHTKR